MKTRMDLHIHGLYSSGVSEEMELSTLARTGKKKGVDILGTGDCLHPRWREEIKNLKKEREGVYSENEMLFFLTTEVETQDRVHHLLLFPSMSKLEELYERLKPFSENIDDEGRPRLSISSEELALMCSESSVLFGPGHAFTPYTALYGHHDSLKSAYGRYASNVSFLELGLSADSSYADRISELHDIPYLSSSDSHSPYPYRLAREFNVVDMPERSFEALKKVFEGKKGKIVENFGLPPEEGKYNESACTDCYTHYSMEECVSRNWKCSCGGTIKKGVSDRVKELSDTEEKEQNSPPYTHLIPLQQILAKAVGHSSPTTKKVSELWEGLIERFGDEISVLKDVPVEELEGTGIDGLADIIRELRTGEIDIQPGGGGEYGKLMPEEDDSNREQRSQRSLTDF